MIRKLCSALATVLAVFAFVVTSAATSAPANAIQSSAQPSTSSDTPTRTALPYEGHYSGSDAHGRHIRFSFSGNQMMNFTVNHTSFGGAHVSGDMWHHTCHNSKCTRGHWTTDVHVVGTWNDPNSGHEVHWEAHLYAH